MTEKYQGKIGTFLQIPNVGKGQLKYIGLVEGKQGLFVGVDLLANIGKNDGTYRGKRYFETEYPQSGLFIQLQKVSWLLEQNSDMIASSTATAVGNTSMQNNQLSIMGSTSTLGSGAAPSTAAKGRNRTNSVIYRSPTPRRVTSRAASMMSRKTQASEQSDFFSDSMEVEDNGNSDVDELDEDDDGDVVDVANAETVSNNDKNSIFLTPKDFKRRSVSYESRIKQQREEIMHYKRLLDDQRIVLEEIQPAIDDYEDKLQYLEAEKNRLQAILQAERENQNRQKQYFEAEHEQLLSVVDELHKEIKENEERMIRQRRRQTVILEDDTQVAELESLKYENDDLKKQLQALKRKQDELEKLRFKWDTEREKLTTHNNSLNQEFDAISRELVDTQRRLDDVIQSQSMKSNTDVASYQSEIEMLRRELEEARSLIGIKSPGMSSRGLVDANDQPKIPGESLPLYDARKNKDAAAGRLLWCALCEKDGHSAFECTEVAF